MILPLIVLLASACAAQQEAHNMLTPAERAAGWRLLFDGHTTAGWHPFQKTTGPEGWSVEDGALVRTGPGGDIVTAEEFQNFELTLEWNVAEGGNSGIFFRVTESGGWIFETGPEMQVLDDIRHADGQSRLTAAGSNFGLHPAPEGVVKPAGEWNGVRILVYGTHVEHWLNGQKVVDYELGSPEWEANVKASKFAQWPGYGRAPKGRIALQDHGDRVAYRDIKIRVLR